MASTSLLLALSIVALVGNRVNIGLQIDVLHILGMNLWILIPCIALAVIVGLLAGLYPAFVLSGFDAINILRGRFQTGAQGVMLRKTLVVLQFVAAVAMIITTFMVSRQIDFIRNKNLGFAKEQVVNFNVNDGNLIQQMNVFRDRIVEYDKVKAVGFSSNMPGRTYGRTGMYPGDSTTVESEEMWIVSQFSMDEKYLETMGMQLAAGRNFDPSFSTDQQEAVMINRAMQEAIGWGDPVGQIITLGNNQERTVVGVIEDFHFANMRHKIEPVLIFFNPGPIGNLSVKIDTDDIRETLSYMETTWAESFPNYPFEYQFFDEEFDQIIASDERFSVLINSFTWLSIILSSLGLFGLSSFTAEQRRKEIGVRKVLGSTVSAIVMLLTREFLVLVTVASVIAWPIAFWASRGWITEFEYKIAINSPENLAVFGLAALGALAVALIAVGYKTVSAALVNPVRSLRDE